MDKKKITRVFVHLAALTFFMIPVLGVGPFVSASLALVASQVMLSKVGV